MIDLPHDWVWTDYHRPTAYSADGDSFLNVVWSDGRPNLRHGGVVPGLVVLAFRRRVLELEAKDARHG